MEKSINTPREVVLEIVKSACLMDPEIVITISGGYGKLTLQQLIAKTLLDYGQKVVCTETDHCGVVYFQSLPKPSRFRLSDSKPILIHTEPTDARFLLRRKSKTKRLSKCGTRSAKN